MHRRPWSSSVPLALVALALTPALAPAHQGNPNFRSTITRVTPATPGVSLDVLSLDDRLELTNRSDRTVLVGGYNDEPYVRIKPDGTVQVNRRSPAGYLNEDRYARQAAPAFASSTAAPQWRTIDKTGRYEWHDHRIHYMAQGVPPQVKDTTVRTKVFAWTVPLTVGTTRGAVAGELFWQPEDDSGPPVAAIGALALLLAGGGVLVAVVRRRRGPPTPEAASPTTEAW
ncbi:MAG: hypothetical protein JWP18_1980 [Solirubrobacterales bacterium]|nr:hypothetical protein [Solirubrobacterales bacterium]